ncbi:MAG: hypothetical protein L6311_05020, partial [Cellulomonas sp.]|nr:hypothetical protein [Cellulomonas sp.]
MSSTNAKESPVAVAEPRTTRKGAPAPAPAAAAAPGAPAPAAGPDPKIAAAIDELVANATKALAQYASFDQEQIDRLVKKAAVAALDQHGVLAKLAVEETGRGVFEDKAVKNIFACEHVTHSMA